MNYDIIIIGGGPAGYVAAIRAAQLGFNVACIDKWINKNNTPSLGGTCLNVGCIPSKALLESSHLFESIKHSEKFGISANATVDIKKMLAHKDKITTELTGGIAALFKANKVDWLQGVAKLLKNNTVSFTDHNNSEQTFTATNIILATGSVPIIPPNMPLGKKVIDSESALNLNKIPKKLCVIGSGAIGLELGSVWKRLGSEVIILEKENFLAVADNKIAKVANTIFKKQKLKIVTKAEVLNVNEDKKTATVTYKVNNKVLTEQFDNVIVAVGRKAYIDNLLAEDCEVELDGKGRIAVDDYCQTSIPSVYAIGDIIKGPMLAHKASEDGVMVIERLAGQKTHIDYNLVPMVIYTHPEIAWVGKTEEQLKKDNIKYKVGEFSFIANGRAKSADETDGMVKIIADEETDKVLGIHIIGHNASEMIAIGVGVMEFEGSSEDIARTIFAHPTLSEAIHEAALAVDGRALHAISRKK